MPKKKRDFRKKNKKKSVRTFSGFTFVELLIVIAIIGILATVVLIILNPVEQFSKSRDTSRLSAVDQLGKALENYSVSHSNTYPPLVTNWQTNTLKPSGDIQNVITVPITSQGACGGASPPNAEGNICYATSFSDAIIWTPVESTTYSSVPNCSSGQTPVIMYIESEGKAGLTCLANINTVPNPNLANNLYNNITLYSLGNSNLTPFPTSGITPSSSPTSYPSSGPSSTPTLTNTPTPTPTPTPSPFPYVSGNKIVYLGNSLKLRGTQIPSAFNSGTWNNGASIPQAFPPQIFSTIASWKMNILRIPIAAYRYQLTNYMSLLDQVVQEANQAGLYVVLANFEDNRAGMGTVGTNLLDTQGLALWQFMAQHYASNKMVFFDPINEPQNTSWTDWLNGDSNGVVGMQTAVNAIRAAGGQQIIVAESIDQSPWFQGFTSFINDPNIMYSMHEYFKSNSQRTTSGWDSVFGNMAGTYPMYIGEWAFLPNANYTVMCSGLNATSGTSLVNSFLSYMDSKNVNWSAWAFNQYHLIQDLSSFSPTFLLSPNEDSCCGNGPSASCNFGMGTVINQYLSTH